MVEIKMLNNLSIQSEILMPVDSVQLEGDLVVPPGATGVVIFAHGSGSSRHSRRNQFVARVIRIMASRRYCSTC